MAYSSDKAKEYLSNSRGGNASADTGMAARAQSILGIRDTSTARSWGEEYDRAIESYNKASGLREGKWTNDSSRGHRKRVQHLLDTYSDAYEEEDGTGRYARAYDNLNRMLNNFDEGDKYYSQWSSQEDFDKYRSGYTGQTFQGNQFGLDDKGRAALREQLYANSGKNADALKKRMAEIERSFVSSADAAAQTYFMSGGSTKDYAYEHSQEYRQLQKELQAEETYARQYERSSTAAYDKWKDYAEAAQKSNVDTTYKGVTLDQLQGVTEGGDFGSTDDQLGLFLQIKEAKDSGKYGHNAMSGYDTGDQLIDLAYNIGVDNGWDVLSKDSPEVKTYYALRAQDPELANQYLQDIKIDLSRQRSEQVKQQAAEEYEQAPITSTVKGVFNSVYGGAAAGLYDAYGALTGNYNPYNSGTMAQDYGSQIHEEVANSASKLGGKIAKKFTSDEEAQALVSEFAGNTASGLLSRAESVLGALTLGGGAYTWAMGLGAGAEKSRDLYEKGASGKEIAFGSIGSGLAEAAFEYLSAGEIKWVKNYLDSPAANIWGMLARAGVSSLTEGLEELCTEYANQAIDRMNRGDFSDYNLRIAEIMKTEGKSFEEARKQADDEVNKAAAWAFYGGAVAGLGDVGAYAVKAAGRGAKNAVGDFATGYNINKLGNASQLEAQAAKLQDTKQAAKLGQQAAAVSGITAESHKEETDIRDRANENWKVGRVAGKIARQANIEGRKASVEAFRAAVKPIIEANDKINAKNKDTAVKIATKAFAGEYLLPNQEKYLNNVLGGMDFIDSVVYEKDGDTVRQEFQKEYAERLSPAVDTLMSVQELAGVKAEEDSGARFNSTGVDRVKVTQEDGSTSIENIENAKFTEGADGNLAVDIGGGKTAKVADITFGSYGKASLFDSISKMGLSVTEANEAIEDAQSSGIGRIAFAEMATKAYSYGNASISWDVAKQRLGNSIPEALAQKYYEYGKKYGKAMRSTGVSQKHNVTRDNPLAREGIRSHNEDGVWIADSIDVTKLNQQQRHTLAVAKLLTAAGYNVGIMNSTAEQRAAGLENGSFNTKTGDIIVDINSGMNGEGVGVFTISHEVTHAIREFDAQSWNDLVSILSDHMGETWETLVQQELGRIESDINDNEDSRYANMSADEKMNYALDEAAARACQTILTDTNAIDQVAKDVRAKNPKLFNKIAELLKQIAKRIRNAYKEMFLGSGGDTERQAREMLRTCEAIRDTWVRGALNAGQAMQTLRGEAAGEQAEKNTADGGVRLATRYDIVDVNGKEYDTVVQLDKHISKRVISSPVKFLDYIVKHFAGQRINVLDKDGNVETLVFAKADDYVSKNGRNRHPVLGELAYTSGSTRKEVIVNLPEVAAQSQYDPKFSSGDNEHDWLDRNGWESRKTYVLADDGKIYEAYLKIGKAEDGRNILYAVNCDATKGIAVDQGATQKRAAVIAAMPSNKKVSHNNNTVNPQNKRKSSRYSAETKAAIDAFRAQTDAAAKAQKAVYEAQIQQMEQSYKRQINTLEAEADDRYNDIRMKFNSIVEQYDAKVMEAGAYDEQRNELMQALQDEVERNESDNKILQKEIDRQTKKVERYKSDNNIWKKEFDRLTKEWESSGRSIEKLTEKVEHQRQAAKDKVERHRVTEQRARINDTVKTLQQLLLKPDTKRHVPDGLRSSVAMALEAIELNPINYQREIDKISEELVEVNKNGNKIAIELERAKANKNDGAKNEEVMRKRLASNIKKAEPLQERLSKLSKLDINKKEIDNISEKLAKINKDIDKISKELANSDNNGGKKKEEYLQKMLSSNTKKAEALRERLSRLNKRDTNIKAAIAAMKAEYAKIADDGTSVYDEGIAQLMDNALQLIGDKPYSDMNSQELEAIGDTYRAILHRVRTVNKAFRQAQGERIDTIVQSVKSSAAAAGQKAKMKSAWRIALDKIMWNNLKPVYAFERMDNPAMKRLFDSLRKGEDTWYRDMAQAQAFLRGEQAKYNYDQWDMDTMYTFESSSGMEFQLSLDDIMSLYAYSRRDQARDHIRKGGIVFDKNTERTVKGKLGIEHKVNVDDATAYNISDATLDDIIGKLTSEQRRFVESMQDYLSTIMGAKGNEVSMALYDIKLFGEKNYWPLRSSEDYSATAKENNANPGNKIKNSGFTKATIKNASNPVVLTGFMDTWDSHIDQMSMYHAMTLPMEDFYRVWNWKTGSDEMAATQSVQAMFRQAYGQGAVDYIDQLLKDINGGLRPDPRESLLDGGLSKFKKAAVMASMSVVVQQPTAVVRAFSVIPANYFVGSRVENADDAWEQCKNYAPIAGIKEMGRFDTNVSKSNAEWLSGRDFDGLKDAGKALLTEKGHRADAMDYLLGWAPEMADKVTWIQIWEASKRMAADKYSTLTGEALLHKAGKIFTEAIVKTQVYDSVFSRSANMRSKGTFAKMVTSFMAEPTTTINMVEDAARKFAKGDKKSAGKILAAVAGSIIVNALISSVVYAGRDDDEDETYAEKYLQSVTGQLVSGFNPITYIPIAKDIWSIFQGYDVERADMSLWSDMASGVNRLVTVAGKYNDDFSSEQREKWQAQMSNASWDAAMSIGNLLGIPARNLRRDILAVVNTYNNRDSAGSTYSPTQLILQAAKEETPIWNKINTDGIQQSKTDSLYYAILSGDERKIAARKADYTSYTSYHSAIRTGLREKDPRIRQAAEAQAAGNNQERIRIAKEIIKEGFFSQDDVVMAINAEVNELKADKNTDGTPKHKSIYYTDDYVLAVANRIGSAEDIRKDLIDTKKSNGVKDPENSVKNNITSSTKELWAAGSLTKAQAINVLTANGYSPEKASEKFAGWEIQEELGEEFEWSTYMYQDYAEYAKPVGISPKVYDEFRSRKSKITGTDQNGDGKADPRSKRNEFIAIIDSLPLTPEQKTALFKSQKTWKWERNKHACPWVK